MKSVKKILYSVFIISFVNIVFTKNFVYADFIWEGIPAQKTYYSPLYYISIIGVLVLVVGVSILILRSIYKSNKLENINDKEDEKGVEKNDRS